HILSARHHPPRNLHSFPTRRSSDLPCDPHPRRWPRRHRGAPRQAAHAGAVPHRGADPVSREGEEGYALVAAVASIAVFATMALRSEEHTSELQSRRDLVCRLLLEKK